MRYNEAMHELGNWDLPLVQQLLTPSPQLRPYLRPYQLLTGEHVCHKSSRWYILPDNYAHLIFYLAEKDGKTQASLKLIGPRTRHLVINRVGRKFTFITTFRPAALWPFCQVPMHTLTDHSTDGRLLFDWVDDELIERLAELATSGNIEGFIRLLEQNLLARIGNEQLLPKALPQLANMTHDPLIKVSGLAKSLGITERHLRNLSHTYIGHSPKSVLQIERFIRSLLLSNQHREWTAIACEAGYYDQSHMIAEYQKMTGKSPERLFEEKQM